MTPTDRFQADARIFCQLGGQIDESRPILTDFEPEYSVDGQYMFMGLWAFDRIRKAEPGKHVDVGGDVDFLAYLSRFVPVEHVDIRDAGLRFNNFKPIKASVTSLPYQDNSLESLSCLHVAEHIGLGRYGDSIDPEGFNKACRELVRVLKPGGQLYFAVPTGKPKIVFNAHRVLSSEQVRQAFHELPLVEFVGMTSDGIYAEGLRPESLDDDRYGCGMYLFTK